MSCQVINFAPNAAELALNYAIIGEIPIGSKDGVNTTFVLDNPPSTPDELALFFNGVRLEKVAAAPGLMQFVIAGQIITLGLAPNSGDTIFADYTRG